MPLEVLENAHFDPSIRLGWMPKARFLVRIDSTDEVAELDSHPLLSGLKRLIVGGRQQPAVCQRLRRGRRQGRSARVCAKSVETADAWLIEVGAGEKLARGPWRHCSRMTALDWRTRIDSSQVGAAPIQNIGAYGLELAERFNSLVAWDFDQHRTVRLALDECNFGIATDLQRDLASGRLITLVGLRCDSAGNDRWLRRCGQTS